MPTMPPDTPEKQAHAKKIEKKPANPPPKPPENPLTKPLVKPPARKVLLPLRRPIEDLDDYIEHDFDDDDVDFD
jgi:hypothetical protein